MGNKSLKIDKEMGIEGLIEVEPEYLNRRAQPEYGYSSYGRNEDGENDQIQIREVWRRIRKHKWLIFSIVVIVTTLTSIYAFRTKPWYTASTIIEVGKENSMTLKSGEVILNDDSDPNYAVNINTKILFFDDPELYKAVAQEQKLETNPIFNAPQDKNTSSSWMPRVFGSSNESEQIKEVRQTGDLTESKKFERYAAQLRQATTVDQIKNTRALKISFTSEDPQLAAVLANSVATIFRKRSFDSQTEKYTNSVDWLDRSTRELKAKVQTAEESLAAYTKENQIYSTDSGSSENKGPTLTTAKLTQLHDQYIRTQTERMLKKSLYDQVKSGRIAEVPEAFSDSQITDSKKKINDLKTKLSELQVKFGPSNPKVQEVQSQIAVLESQIQKNTQALELKLKADYERAVNDEQSLAGALTTAKSSAVNENQAAIKYNILKQDVETARGLYTDFLQKTNQAKAQYAEQNNNIKVIQNAQIPVVPVGPKRTQNIVLGFVMSLALGIGLAFFIEYLDDTIKSLEDIDRYAQLPLLGVIPALNTNASRIFGKKAKAKEITTEEDGSQLGLEIPKNAVQLKLISNLEGHSIAGEAYRALRTSLLLSTAGTPPKTILVTSGQASEGKSTTAVHTAIALAQLGAKVLIMDCDLRRPAIHKHLNISSTVGVTNFLSTSTNLDAMIQTLLIPNLTAITSGPIPPNPAELLSSSRMKEMIRILSEKYDHIVIDSPPISNVTDPVILSTLVDGTMMIIHGGKTSRNIVQRSRQELQNVRAKIFGVVLNNVDLRKDGYDYYYYRYEEYTNAKN